MKRPTAEEIKKALEQTQGNMTNAAKLLGYRRETLWVWGKKFPDIAEVIRDSKKQLLDKCLTTAQALALGIPIRDENGKFIGWQEKPDSQMLRFFITTLGRDEGFGDAVDITTNGERLAGGIQIEVIDSRDKVAKKEEEEENANDL